MYMYTTYLCSMYIHLHVYVTMYVCAFLVGGKCVHVCVCDCLLLCAYVHVHVCVSAYVRICTCTCMCV